MLTNSIHTPFPCHLSAVTRSVGPTQLEVVNSLSGFDAKRTHECIVKHDGAMYGFVETLTSRVVVFLHVDQRGLAILKIKK